ncbi:MAG: phosphonate ABC transporter, permease protein PhnE [Nitriliruptorales bacterium]|nr:phosphonate ABC transporter, permease protein PhnE [Nitriliruptorales bacterium]
MSWQGPAAVLGFLVLTWWAWVGIELSIGEIVQNISNAGRIIEELLDPAWGALNNTYGPFLETIRMAVIASVIGCSVALVVGFLASRVSAPDVVTFGVSKSVMSVIRSIPDVLYALVFVTVFSIGPMAGILALILFNIGVVAKLLSETVDGVDPGPIEAADAAGATLMQRVRTAVFPQVLPNYLAYSLYVFELNIRASAVIGLVGAGGIGQFLNVARNAFRYDVISVIVIEIFVFVFVIETISIAIRRRLV